MNKIIAFFRKKDKKKQSFQLHVENALDLFQKEHCEKCNSDMGWKCQSCYCATIIFVVERWLKNEFRG